MFLILRLCLFCCLTLTGVSVNASDDDRLVVIERGVWEQGSVLIGKVAEGHQLEFMGRTVGLTDDHRFVIGLGRDFPATATLNVTDSDGQRSELSFPVAKREYKIQRVEGVPARTVNPDPSHLQRIREEAGQVRRARADISERTDWAGEFKWPLLGPITGVYGSQRYYNGEPKRPHFGVDVYAPVGTTVLAPVSGRVVLAHDDMFYSGGTLILDHGYGLTSTLMHLSKLLVQPGEIVTQGQPVAEVGASGRATGPHLDWRMNWFDQRVDPQTLVPEMPAAH